MKLRMIMIALALLLPLTAAATNFVTVTADADCVGWSIDAEIYWRPDLYEGELSYIVELLDADSNVLETQQWTGVVTRVDNPEIVSLSGEWTVTADPGNFVMTYSVTINAPIGGSFPDTEEGSHSFACDVVATESMSWSSLKALY